MAMRMGMTVKVHDDEGDNENKIESVRVKVRVKGWCFRARLSQ